MFIMFFHIDTNIYNIIDYSESTPTPKVVVTEKEPTPGRKPLYEPKYRNQLPARPPKYTK